MEVYSINDVASLTGIKAHTLRVWEKRYNTLIPHRTSTKIRYYDNEQLRKLLNVATLIQQGYKTSLVLGMEEQQVNELILQGSNGPESDNLCNILINDLITAMVAFDEPAFDKVFSSAITRFGIYEAMLKVVYPFMHKTGVLWNITNVIPAQEHFASNIIKRKLLAAIDGIPFSRQKSKKFLLFLPPDEWHEVGLLFADYVIRTAGAETIYLGQNVPYSNLQTTIEQVKPDNLLTFVVGGLDTSGQIKYLAGIAKAYPKISVLVCGKHLDATVRKTNNVIFVKDPGKIFEYL